MLSRKHRSSWKLNMVCAWLLLVWDMWLKPTLRLHLLSGVCCSCRCADGCHCPHVHAQHHTQDELAGVEAAAEQRRMARPHHSYGEPAACRLVVPHRVVSGTPPPVCTLCCGADWLAAPRHTTLIFEGRGFAWLPNQTVYRLHRLSALLGILRALLSTCGTAHALTLPVPCY